MQSLAGARLIVSFSKPMTTTQTLFSRFFSAMRCMPLVFVMAWIVCVVAVVASPAHARSLFAIDEGGRKVGAWRVGYNRSLAGCLAVTRYKDKTTFWIGYTARGRGHFFVALSNPAWTPIEPKQTYRVRVMLRKKGVWNAKFRGFRHTNATDSEKVNGLFAAALSKRFVSQFAAAPGVHFFVSNKRIAALSLNNSKSALASIRQCYKERSVQAARDAAAAKRRRALAKSEQGPFGGFGGRQRKRRKRLGSGTGFVMTTLGHIVTNNHVAGKCKSIQVGYSGGPLIAAKLLATDKRNDLALLKAKLPIRKIAVFRPRVRVGESIYVYGFPLTGLLTKTGNFTVGYVTAEAGVRENTSQMQISAPVQRGNSGGPLIDQHGNVVGVIVSKLNAMRVARLTNDVAQNVNFAIKSSIAIKFLEANGVTVPLDRVKKDKMEPADIADRAKDFTVRILCSYGT